MPVFSKRSQDRLITCDKRIQLMCNEIIPYFDFTILEGHRTRATHLRYIARGATRVKYEKSKHSTNPSQAIDIAPYPIDWNDTKRFFYLAGMMKAIAQREGFPLRWGGDWDGDNVFTDQRFNDYVHFELTS